MPEYDSFLLRVWRSRRHAGWEWALRLEHLGHPGRRSLAAALVICVCVALLNSWPVAHGAWREAAPPRAHAGNTHPSTSIPAPYGLYVLNDAGNDNPVADAYDPSIYTSAAYRSDVAGAAIYVPIYQILPTVTTWSTVTSLGQFGWDWTYVNTLVKRAVSLGRKFSIALEVGYGDPLPNNFAAACGADCAPLFHVWAAGGQKQGACLAVNVPLPWVSNVQQFWRAALTALAADLHAQGTYSSLTLVHVPGVSVYDEEIRLPSGTPSSDTCPGSGGAALQREWLQLGYSDQLLVSGFKTIVSDVATAFPDKYIGLSLFPPVGGPSAALAFPSTRSAKLTLELVNAAAGIAPGRLELQSDDLDPRQVTATRAVTKAASRYQAIVGWQSNKRGGQGAACGMGTTHCNTSDAGTPNYLQLLANANRNGGLYVEVWSHDVATYTEAFAAAIAHGWYPPTPPPPHTTPPSPPLHCGLKCI